MNALQKTNADAIKAEKLGGFVVNRDGSSLKSDRPDVLHSQLSESLCQTIFDEDEVKSIANALPGRVVSLVGHTAFPCVCEVPPSSAPLFSPAGAKVVSQGITWQSLYLVLLGRNFVLAEPEPR